MDCSLPGFSVHGILQARTLEWVAISISNAWKWKVKVKSLSHVRLFMTPWTAAYQAPPPMGFSRQEYWSGVPSPLLDIAKFSSTGKSKYFRSIYLLGPYTFQIAGRTFLLWTRGRKKRENFETIFISNLNVFMKWRKDGKKNNLSFTMCHMLFLVNAYHCHHSVKLVSFFFFKDEKLRPQKVKYLTQGCTNDCSVESKSIFLLSSVRHAYITKKILFSVMIKVHMPFDDKSILSLILVLGWITGTINPNHWVLIYPELG